MQHRLETERQQIEETAERELRRLGESLNGVASDALHSIEMDRPESDLLEVPGGVLMQQARDQGLVRQPLGQRALLDRLQILAR